jgi:hypothetical protein
MLDVRARTVADMKSNELSPSGVHAEAAEERASMKGQDLAGTEKQLDTWDGLAPGGRCAAKKEATSETRSRNLTRTNTQYANRALMTHVGCVPDGELGRSCKLWAKLQRGGRPLRRAGKYLNFFLAHKPWRIPVPQKPWARSENVASRI